VAQTETSTGGVLDIIKLLIAAAGVEWWAASMLYYYYGLNRAGGSCFIVLGGTIAGYRHCDDKSVQGQRLWHFIRVPRVSRFAKVVWPAKQETTQNSDCCFHFYPDH